MAAHVRINSETQAKLRQLAEESIATMSAVVAQAIDELYRIRFLNACNQAYARLRAEPRAWQQELKVRRAWDSTLGDGLADL